MTLPSLPLHHLLRKRSPSPSLRDREDFLLIVIPDSIRDPRRQGSYGSRIKSGMTKLANVRPSLQSGN